MKRIAVVAAALAVIGVAVAAPTIVPKSAPAPAPVPAPSSRTPTAPAAPASTTAAAATAVRSGDTPMRERVATLGLLNKRNGLSRDLRMRPGEAVRIGDVVVRLKACDATADWEADKLTGAFVQVIVRGADTKWRKYFSGWLFRESPSLNAVEHPIYDVWTKDCTMRHAEVGPDTVSLAGGQSSPPGKRSSAKKSPTSSGAKPDATPATAASSNTL